MKTKITIFILIIILGVLGISYGLVSIPYSEGVRSGRLVKLSKKGILYSTYEGTLDLGSGDQLTWNFSIHDKKIGEQLVKLSGQKVKLSYDELFFKLFYETKYNVLNFKLVNEGQADGSFCELVTVVRSFPEIVKVLRLNLRGKTQFCSKRLKHARTRY